MDPQPEAPNRKSYFGADRARSAAAAWRGVPDGGLALGCRIGVCRKTAFSQLSRTRNAKEKRLGRGCRVPLRTRSIIVMTRVFQHVFCGRKAILTRNCWARSRSVSCATPRRLQLASSPLPTACTSNSARVPRPRSRQIASVGPIARHEDAESLRGQYRAVGITWVFRAPCYGINQPLNDFCWGATQRVRAGS